MQSAKFGRDLMDLEADMVCLKRQLAMILDENHVLKVKIRRLENDMLRKNKYIDYLHMNAQKVRDNRRMAYESASSTILKLKRQNEDLRGMLIKREVEDQKRAQTMKTMLLYRQLDHKSLRKPPRKSSRHLDSEMSFDNATNGPKRLGSLSDSNTLPKEYYRAPRRSFYSNENPNDNSKVPQFSQADAEELIGMINMLKRQCAIDRSIIHAKNSDIAQLTAELNETKAQFKFERLNPSPSSILLGSVGSGDRKNFIGNQMILSKSAEFESFKKTYRDIEMNISSIEHKKSVLEPVQELSEDETFATSSDQSVANVYNSNCTIRTKTPIEYIIDSEVSSDGEDIFIVNKLKNFHRKTIGTMS